MLINIPLEFLPKFRDNPDSAVLEYLSIPSASMTLFFRNLSKIVEAVKRGSHLPNPLDEGTYTFAEYFKATNDLPRYMHIDLAINRDGVGICMSHASGFVIQTIKQTGLGSVDVSLPIIQFDFIGRLKPRQEFNEREMNFNAIYDMIFELAYKRKFNLHEGLVTFDRFQSHMLMSNIKSLRIPCGLLSVDRTTGKLLVDFSKDGYVRRETSAKEPSAAMGALRDAAYQDRLILPQMSISPDGRTWIEDEAEQCQWDVNSQTAVKMEGGTDDVLQSVAGSCFNCANNASPFQGVDAIRETQEELNVGRHTEDRFYDNMRQSTDRRELDPDNDPSIFGTKKDDGGFTEDSRFGSYYVNTTPEDRSNFF